MAFRPQKFAWEEGIALVGRHASNLTYAVGYYESANLLVDDAPETLRADYFIYPVIYCYRHAAELILKYLLLHFRPYIAGIKRTGQVVDIDEDDLVNKLESTHSLLKLAARLRRAVEVAMDEPLPSHVWSAITSLHVLDTKSTASRYATDKDGQPSFPNTSYDLAEIKALVAPAIDYLISMTAWLDAQQQTLDDYLSDLMHGAEWSDSR